MKPISLPALAVAAARARESGREGRLFDDALAASLAGPEGAEWLERIDAALPPPAGDGPSPLALRTRFFDDFLAGAVAAPSLRQVVLVGAGMDARAFRLPWPEGTLLYELDDAALLERKSQVLASSEGASPRCTRKAVAVDLDGDWEAALAAAGFDRARPSAWLVEGLLPYLDAAGVHRLLQPLSKLAAPGSVLGADLPSATSLVHQAVAPLMALLAERGAPWRFGADSPEKLFSLYGWSPKVEETWEVARRHGYAGPPIPARRVRGVPRSFLVTARRR